MTDEYKKFDRTMREGDCQKLAADQRRASARKAAIARWAKWKAKRKSDAVK
jgi:hypothetical protein